MRSYVFSLMQTGRRTMSNVIDFNEKRRARLGRKARPHTRRARPLKPATREVANSSFRDLGSISSDILRKLME